MTRNDDPSDPYPSHIYAVRRGVVYEAAPTRLGVSYHGYPWRGRIAQRVLRELESRAVASGELGEFKRWVKEYRTK